ncbi:hypothetical protein OC845_003076 [Tilletia horrida]|nr:hypothetical protein OC845_003076 [Tilletia horrida]
MTDAPNKQVHEMARVGFNTATGMGLYDRARPTFPSESMQSIVKSAIAASQGGPIKVAEFGAGTGLSTRSFLNAIVELNGAEKNKVQVSTLSIFEPSPGMRTSFQQGLDTVLPSYLDADIFSNGAQSIEVQEGTFEEFPLSAEAEGSYDVILIAQAWHWAQDHEVALGNFARALKPNGVLALIWNLEDRDAAPWVARLRDAYESHEKGTPQYRLGLWKDMYKTQAYSKYFHALPQEDHYRILPTTKEDAWNRVLSKSYISVLGERDRAALRAEWDKIYEDGDSNGRKWIDESKGIFEYPYVTNLLKFERTSAA